MTLNQVKPGERAIITATGGERTLRLRLLDMGLIPGTSVMVRKVAPMGDPMELYLRGYELTLRGSDASFITVSEVQK